MDKYKLLATVGVLLGLLSLTSMIVYGATGSFWWTEIERQDVDRGFILFFLHIGTWIGGIASFVYLFLEWEPE